MTAVDLPGRAWGLSAPRRNNFYYGKLLDVPHLEMEQRYGRALRYLVNRLSLGAGVLCGLQVSARDGLAVVAPGVGVDELGREIVVGEPFAVDPWLLTDGCGGVAEELARNRAHLVSLRLCHAECLTEYSPALVTDCPPHSACEAGTVVEAFRIEVVPGAPAEQPGGLPAEVCSALFGDGAAPGGVAGELGVVATIPLGGRPAAVAVAADGTWAIVANENGGELTLQILDVAAGELAGEISDPQLVLPLGGVSVAPDGGPVLVTHAGGVSAVDLAADPPLTAVLGGTGYGVCAAAFAGTALFAVNTASGQIDRIDVDGRTVAATIDPGGPVVDLAVSPPDSRWLYAGLGPGATLARISTADNTLAAPAAPADTARTIAVREGPEVRLALPGRVRVLNEGGERDLAVAADSVDSAFTSDGRHHLLLSGPAGGAAELVVLRADDDSTVARVPVGTTPTAVATVPGGQRTLVTNGGDRTVSIVDVGPPDRYRLLCRLLADCPPPPSDPCLHLATVELLAGGAIGRIDPCSHRSVLLSNAALLDLVLCLAERVDACCHRALVRIDPAELPGGIVGQPYAGATITARGGAAPYVLAVVGGALPTGLAVQQAAPDALDLAGTPEAAGTFGFSVWAQDADGRTAVRPYSIVIEPGEQPRDTLRVGNVLFVERRPDRTEEPFEKLGPANPPRIGVRRLVAIRVEFTQDVEPGSLTTVGPRGVPPEDAVSVVVRQNGGVVPAALEIPDARTAVIRLDDDQYFELGEWRVHLVGDDVAHAIRATDGTRLDGEGVRAAYPPSGDGTEGGSFRFDFQIVL